MGEVLKENGHLSHKAKRKLRKKLARQLVRRRNAELRDQRLETEEEAARMLADEELEKQIHDEEERMWIERERIAQELFARKKTLEELEQKSQQEIQKNALAKEQVIKTSFPPTPLTLPPNHCPEPPHLYWKREDLCQFFWKTGACRYGDRCSRHHPEPVIHSSDLASSSSSTPPRLILIIENMFNHYSLQCDPLEVDEAQLQIDFSDFYADVRPELEAVCGGPLEIFRCCRNTSPHLRGNVYIQFTQDSTVASDIALRLRGRLYDGKHLVTRLAYLGKSWESAICGCHLRGKCPRGDANCNYLHIFLNPGERPGSVLTNLPSHCANEKLLRESRRGRSRRRSERHSSRYGIYSMSRSPSRKRHRDQSHKHKSSKRLSSDDSGRPSKSRSRSKERHRHHRSKHRRRNDSSQRSP